jgi:molybdopterin/thiamine biosynthesis adenylyltransferase
MVSGKTPCLRCIFPKKPHDNKAEDVGIIGTAPGFIGVLSASQCLNFLVGDPVLENEMLYATLDDFRVELFGIKRRKGCEACG